MHLRKYVLACSLLFLGACAEPPPAPVGNGEPDLKLTILEPARGTILSNEESIVVRGIAWAADSRPSVSVSGVGASIGANGEFSVELPLVPGLTSIETTVWDASGHQVRDVRGLLLGALRPHGDTIEEAVVAHIDQGSFDLLSRLITDFASDPSFVGQIRSYNPVAEVGRLCLGVTIDVETVVMDSFDIEMTPQVGGLRVHAEVGGLDLGLNAESTVACLDVSRAIPLRITSATVDATVQIALRDGRIDLELSEFDVRLQGMSLDLSLLDASLPLVGIDSMIESRISAALENIVTEQIEDNLGSVLRRLETEPLLAEAMGIKVAVDLQPHVLDFDDNGAWFEASIAVRFPDHIGKEVVYSPTLLSFNALRSRGGGFQLGIADDILNNFLSMLWSAGALNVEIPIDDANAKFFNLDHLEFEPLLPPVVETRRGSVARVAVGDYMVRVIDEADNLVAEAAISGSIGLSVQIEAGQLVVEVIDPDFSIGMSGAQGSTNNTTHLAPWLSELMLVELTPLLSQSIRAMPRLSMREMAVASPSVDATPGYLVMGANFVLGAQQ